MRRATGRGSNRPVLKRVGRACTPFPERRAAPAIAAATPTRSLLYELVREHLETFLDGLCAFAGPGRTGLPCFVKRELRRYLECGVLAHGFARIHCPACKRDSLVAFSCKGRGFCPSCCGRRMSATAAHLVDHILPATRIRQQAPLRDLGLSKPVLPGVSEKAESGFSKPGGRQQYEAMLAQGADEERLSFVAYEGADHTATVIKALRSFLERRP